MIEKVAALIIEDNKILLTKPKGKDYWLLPGGKIKGNEDHIECLERELREELNVELSYSDYYSSFDGEFKEEPVTLHTYFVKVKGDPKLGYEVESAEYFSLKEIDNILILSIMKNKLIPRLFKEGRFT